MPYHPGLRKSTVCRSSISYIDGASDILRFFFSSRRRHTRSDRDWSSDVCSSDLPARRGAVMGTFGAAANIAMALAPIAGLAVADRLGFVPLFQLAACVAVVALLLTQRLPEPARSRATIPFTPGALVSVEALVPSAVLFLVMLGYGALVTFLPIHARQQDVNPGLFFLVFALVVTAVRNYAGHLSDRFGRVTAAAAG